MKNLIIAVSLLVVCPFLAAGQTGSATVFRFDTGKDAFVLTLGGNGDSFSDLVSRIEACREQINAGMSIRVEGYYSQGEGTLKVAVARSNHVKSALISRLGLKESDFRTKNRAGQYEGADDVVVVKLDSQSGEVIQNLRITPLPAKLEQPEKRPQAVIVHKDTVPTKK